MNSGHISQASCAIIAGSGLYNLEGVLATSPEVVAVETPYSRHPVDIQIYRLTNLVVAFLPRHGSDHRLPPHRIPYKANMLALQELGVKQIFALNAVGGIDQTLDAGALVVPDQIIDYTWGREHSYFDDLSGLGQHIDFTYPYDETLRQHLIATMSEMNMPVETQGVYGCTQGPRLETAAEIKRMAIDGCTVVGQTTMPETSLARELGMQLASLCLVVNRAAGIEERPLSIDEIKSNLATGMKTAGQIVGRAVQRLT